MESITIAIFSLKRNTVRCDAQDRRCSRVVWAGGEIDIERHLTLTALDQADQAMLGFWICKATAPGAWPERHEVRQGYNTTIGPEGCLQHSAIVDVGHLCRKGLRRSDHKLPTPLGVKQRREE